VYSWDIATSSFVGRLVGHKDYIHAMALASGALYTASEDGTVRVWDARSSTPCRATMALPGSSAYLSCLAVSDDAHWLAAGGGASVVGVWHAPSQNLSTSLSHTSPIGAVTFAARGEVGQRAVAASTSSSGASLVVGVCGAGGLSHWQLDGRLRMRVPCAPSCVYSIAVGRSTGYEMLTVGGSCSTVDAFFGDYAASAAQFEVL
jgi:WD40 repeat protein